MRDVLDDNKEAIMFYVKNVPNAERAARVLAGLGAAAAALYWFDGNLALLLAASAAGIALTGLVGYCPMCAIVGRRLDGAPGGPR